MEDKIIKNMYSVIIISLKIFIASIDDARKKHKSKYTWCILHMTFLKKVICYKNVTSCVKTIESKGEDADPSCLWPAWKKPSYFWQAHYQDQRNLKNDNCKLLLQKWAWLRKNEKKCISYRIISCAYCIRPNKAPTFYQNIWGFYSAQRQFMTKIVTKSLYV